MNKFSLIGILLIILVVVFIVLFFVQSTVDESTPPVPTHPIFKNNTATVEEKITDLLSYMTLEEKIGQMTLIEKNSIQSVTDISKYGLGALLSGFGGSPEENTITGWREMVDAFQTEAGQSRLGIPLLYGVDAIHGHSNVPGLVVFPHAIGLGASGDEVLVKDIARATREQLLLTSVNWNYSPTYDMPQDIRWGRVYETFSDDPALVSRLGSVYIQGLQGEGAISDQAGGLLATPKHFVGVGSMEWNTASNKDYTIDQGVTPVDQQRLREILLPPYEQAIAAGALSIMVGLNSWGDTKLAAESYLIQTVLKEELDFSGFVVSDWYGVYEISDDKYLSAVTAINAGVDMVMLPYEYKKFIRHVKRAVQSGDITQERIDDAVRRILRAKFTAGLFSEKASPEVTIDQEAHALLARRAVAQSAVLLKNDSTLPVTAKASTILVSGSAADNIGRQAGAWTVQWQGIDGNELPGATSILEGIQSVADPDTQVLYSPTAEFEVGRVKADIGIAVVGESPYAEGLGDNPNPTLTAEDLQIIERLKASSKKVVVVLVIGRPLIISNQLDGWDALVVAWLPGSEGAGVADVLFGKELFTATLPLPWPASIEQLPITTAGETADGSPLLFKRYFAL